jgi:hypothetical protein
MVISRLILLGKPIESSKYGLTNYDFILCNVRSEVAGS